MLPDPPVRVASNIVDPPVQISSLSAETLTIGSGTTVTVTIEEVGSSQPLPSKEIRTR